MCFDKGSTKKKLDQFLTIFQVYVACKKDAPMDVEFMISDTFDAIRPDMQLFKTFEEAGAAVDELLASQALSSAGQCQRSYHHLRGPFAEQRLFTP